MSNETLDEPIRIVTLPELLIEDGSETLPGMYRVGDDDDDDETSTTDYDVQFEIASNPPTVDTTDTRLGLTDIQEVMTRNSITTFIISAGQYYRLSVKATSAGAVSEEVWVQLEELIFFNLV
jgi:hypothetical protein